ncbi:MAG: aminomethyl-transferring glycine dehydrogenase [Prevotellaceae bacterium]|jgi:glycine dehydrogenase|nr:aminomethyl-transferring glycine dehydrogenase [Prevotellaceae bacterium]
MNEFVLRHNGPREKEINDMLEFIGAKSMDDLISQTIPDDIRLQRAMQLSAPLSEYEFLNKIRAVMSKNCLFRSFIGMGWYGTATPAVILRNVFENPAWYTSYTPYQAEISQGRLEALLNFQTMITSLTGMEISNCSLLDEATAAAEAMKMMFELRQKAAVKAGKNVFFVDENVFPQTADVILTRSRPLGIVVEFGDFAEFKFHDKVFGALVQYPSADGSVRDYSDFCSRAHSAEALVAVSADLLSLALLPPPVVCGADVVVGSSQRFGIPMGFGGPSAGFIATREVFKRSLPGRIIGVSVDRRGKRALRMALQTREQHIKRERATSNICTSQALLASMAGMFAVYHGSEGIRAIALRVHRCAALVYDRLRAVGYNFVSDRFFDTLELCKVSPDEVRRKSEELGFNFFYPKSGNVHISFDELTSVEELTKVLSVFGIEEEISEEQLAATVLLYGTEVREFLKEDVFRRYRSETEMMRYIKRLERRDVSLTHSMISLGSCTMKLNAAAEMLPLSWPEVCNIHPLAPSNQTEGYRELISSLSSDLAAITGFEAVSFQPNSGAAGEYAGLMLIRQYHLSRGDEGRNVALIPSSAHGTNPASAAMAGMEVVTVSCDARGNVDLDDLRRKAEEFSGRLSCIMITYPSTHGVFEGEIREICKVVHHYGGQVYMDGANMNAQVGFTSPGFIGADVCHLNLHKTFAIPHGGGGPGAGPVCVAHHLKEFLPVHPLVETGGSDGIRAVASAPYGSAMILPITYGYIKMLGDEGLRRATSVAILNANYLSRKLAPYYSTLYTGVNGRVAHECILDLRDFGKLYGVDATDVAKRLMDYGFHAPTLSFPVANTLMIEPTESESLQELDRFIEAMISIKKECEEIAEGKLDREDNPLRMAPHTELEASSDDWTHGYSRVRAVFPLKWIEENKFWPSVSRVDNGYGDRNLVCNCEN